jgi:CheY-like chemotaxis protein
VSAEGTAPVSRPLRALVADDDKDAADTLAALVKAWGHEARAVYDGRAAIREALDFRSDVAILDLVMPQEDGIGVAAALRGQPDLKNALMIAVTGYDEVARHFRFRSTEFDYYLVKPVDPELLRKLLADRVGP